MLILKHATKRSRPDFEENFRYVPCKKGEEGTPAMPSGDTSACVTWVYLTILMTNQWWLICMVPVVMFGRIWYYCHYFTDTIAGLFLGVFCVGVCMTQIEWMATQLSPLILY